MSAVIWAREESKARARGAKVVNIPEEGETERMPITAVLLRRVWIPTAGIYILRDGDEVQYVGLSRSPLGHRLRAAIANHRTWTRAEWRGWTVTMQRAPTTYGEDRLAVEGLADAHDAPYNVLGRPRTSPGWGSVR
jgi:hypothetical protein